MPKDDEKTVESLLSEIEAVKVSHGNQSFENVKLNMQLAKLFLKAGDVEACIRNIYFYGE